MVKFELEALLIDANNGNELAREQLIFHYKPYIINTVGHLCKRYVTWNEEESSIGLIAFNRAIDTFDSQGGRTFINYVYLLIQRDLIDFFRKEKRNQHLSLEFGIDETDIMFNHQEVDKSIESYHRSIVSTELVEEILELDQTLKQFDISFEELENYCPQHRDTRQLVLIMARKFVEDKECVDALTKKKRLPISLFTGKTGYKAKTIERHRKYLITLILLKLNPQWVQLSEFIQEDTQTGREGLS